MRCESRPVGLDPHVCLRPGTVKIRESGTASNYGSGIKERTLISRRTGTRPDFVFLAGTVVWSKLLKSSKYKHKPFASSGSHSRIRHRWRIHRNRWHQSGADPWLVAGSGPGLRYRQLGPGSQHIMLDPDRFGCLTTVTKKKKSGQLFLRER
jgi:hypothetical protein